MARKRTKRSRKAKRRYIGSALWKWNQKRKRGKVRRRKSKNKRRHGKRKHRRHGKSKSKRRSRRHGQRHAQTGFAVSSLQTYQKLINKGYSPERAHKVAARLERMRKGRISRYFSKQTAEKESEGRLSNLFAGLAAAGRAKNVGL